MDHLQEHGFPDTIRAMQNGHVLIKIQIDPMVEGLKQTVHMNTLDAQ